MNPSIYYAASYKSYKENRTIFYKQHSKLECQFYAGKNQNLPFYQSPASSVVALSDAFQMSQF